jgi:hypothetical protein
MQRPPAVTSIATPLDRAWQRYRAAVQEAMAHPTKAAVRRRDVARKVWLRLFLDRAG